MKSNTIDRFGPALAVAVAVAACLATLTIAGVEPLATLADEPFETALLSAVPVIATFVGCLIWAARSRTTAAVVMRYEDAGLADTANPDSSIVASSDDKRCPDCAELVKDAAVTCRFCGHRFGGTIVRPAKRAPRLGLGLFVAVIGAAGLGLFLRSMTLWDAEFGVVGRANAPAVAAMADALEPGSARGLPGVGGMG